MLHQLIAIMLLVLGASHVLWSGLWADAAMTLTRSRHPATTGMIGGAVSLAVGVSIILAKPSTHGFLIITTIIGWISIAKGAGWLLMPSLMLAIVPRTRSGLTGICVIWGLVAMAAGAALLFAAGGADTTPADRSHACSRARSLSLAAATPGAGPSTRSTSAQVAAWAACSPHAECWGGSCTTATMIRRS